MRKFLIGLGAFAAINGLYAQPLFTYGKYAVGKDEFLRQFNRNLNPKEDREKAIKEYLPLFINYKLKVQDAYDKRLDTGLTQKNELADFRRQIEENYFSEAAKIDQLVGEAYDRSQKDLHLQDVLIGFDPNNPQSYQAAQTAAQQAYQKLQTGAAFENVVAEFCNDADFKSNKGEIGWITLFSLPYKIETEVYQLKPGSFSKPIQTSKAFHIFKNVAERKAVGKVSVAQILFAYPPNSTDTDKAHLQQKADSVYALLQQGGNFATLAATYSLDRNSFQNGGKLPEFGVGSYDPIFEGKAFALASKDELTKPFATSYGIHILKLISHNPVSVNKADALANENLKQQVISDNRMEQAKLALIKKLLPQMGFQLSPSLNKKSLWKYTDSAFVSGNTAAVKDVTAKTVLFKYAKQNITAADWVMFLRASRGNVANLGEKGYEELFDRYQTYSATDYYKTHLDDFNPDFKSQLSEFKDANLNFEITEKMVWNKAATDNVGLTKYYATNKTKYQWGPSVNAIIVTATDKNITAEARHELETNINDWRQTATKFETKLLADSNRFEQNQIPVSEKLAFKAASFTPVVTNAQDSSQTFCYIVNVLDQPAQRTFDEARGFVINDYQQVLEAKWIDALKKKYPIKINETVWQALLKK